MAYNIIIAGSGTVGYSLASNLSYKHNVTVIDKDRSKLESIEESLDLLTICGDLKDPLTYKNLQSDDVDLFIAVTDSDDANLLASLIAEDSLHIGKKIIRLKNDYFSNSAILNRLNINEVVFPDLLTAKKVQSLFDFPKANNVKNFVQFDKKLISVKVHYGSDDRFKIGDFHTVKIVAIERKRTFIIPSFDNDILEGDLLYIFGDSKDIKDISFKIDAKMPHSIKNVVIFGANKSAQNIAKSLLKYNLNIKIIDKDINNCEDATSFLGADVRVIHAPFEDHTLFESENLKNAHMLISAYENDEKNIVKCIEARVFDIEKVVAVNNDKDYYALMHQLGIVVVRGAKSGAHYSILEKISSNTIITISHFCGGTGVMLIRKIYSNSKLIGKYLKKIGIKDVLVYQISDGNILEIDNFDRFKEGDSIVVFGKSEKEDEIQKWIYTL